MDCVDQADTPVRRVAGGRPDWLQALALALESGRPAVLVSVIQVKGSAPRDPGARMWVDAQATHDTIGGGHLEQQAIDFARGMLAGGLPGRCVQRYPLGPRLGQCCGGVVWLAFERLSYADLSWCRQAIALLDAGAAVRRRVCAPLLAERVGAAAPEEATHLLEAPIDAAVARIEWDEASGWLDDFIAPPASTVVVCGAGHVGRAIVNLLAGLPIRLIWLDPRDDAWPSEIPSHVQCIQGDEQDVVDCPDQAYWLVLTHSHALDLAIVEQVLRRKSFRYLGLIGSATKRARFRSQLLQRFPADEVDRVQCPIGAISTSSKRPAVIAVSVAAQLIPLLEAAGNPL